VRAGQTVLGGEGFDALSLLLWEVLDSLTDDFLSFPPAAPAAVEFIIGKIPLDTATAAFPRSMGTHPGVLVPAERARDHVAFLIDRQWQSYEWTGHGGAKDDDGQVGLGFRAQVIHACCSPTGSQYHSLTSARFPGGWHAAQITAP
jgi:hypothetical protein